MEMLARQIRRAHRRMLLQAFIGRLAWCWSATLLLAILAIGAIKLWPPTAESTWITVALSAAIGGGILAAALWTWLRRQSPLEAAVELDRRFGLKERVSSSVALDREQLASDVGQALVRDAQQRVGRLDVSHEFRLRLDRKALAPLAPALAAVLLVLFVNARAPEAVATAVTTSETQIKKSTQTLVKKLEERRKEAAEKGLKEADGTLKQIEDAVKSQPDKNVAERKQTLVKLNELVKDIEKKRQQMTSAADLKQQLNQLKNLQSGPAERLGQALKNVDFKMAMKELDKLKAKLSDDKLSPQEKQVLAKQLDQLQQALEKKTQAHQDAKKELEKQIDAERRAGNTAAADKLQQQLDKLAEKTPQMERLDKMAQQMKQAAESMNKGDSKQAADSLAQLSEQLEGMQKEMDEMAMLDSALEEMADCKNAMTCKECEGEGCAACQGQGEKLSNKWSRGEMAKGGGRGAGDRPESKTETSLYDSQVKQNVGKGASVIAGTADGANRKGQVQAEIKGQFSNAEQQTAEALSDQHLPHDYRDHAKKYFDALREGSR
jgi:tetratricopeptide (TPR) repeat protein